MDPHWNGNRARIARAALAATLALTTTWWAVDADARTSAATNDGAGATVSPAHASDVGPATQSWLALQRSNASAAPALPTPGAQATLAYERYLDSFRSKIPASFGSTLSERNDASRVGDTSFGSGAAQSPGMH